MSRQPRSTPALNTKFSSASPSSLHGKMALLISHRFSTVRMADRIVVLENGNIAEQGSHTQLMALSARYAEMFELQAASYR